MIDEKLRQQRIKDNTALWALEHRTLKGKPFNFNGHNYLIDIYQDTAKEIVIRKSAQSGLSEFILNDSFNKAVAGLTVIYWFPTDSLLSDFVNERVNSAIEESDYLSEIIGQTDNVRVKKIGNGFIYFRGVGQDPKSRSRKLKSIAGDMMCFDEVDEMPPDTFSKAESRIGHSEYKIKKFISTPKYPDSGISMMYEESDQRTWFILCEHCGEKQTLTWQENVDFKNAQIICKKCKQIIDPYKKGEWIARFPERPIHGYAINKLFCSRTDLKKVIERSKAVLEEDIQAFYNDDLGLPYEPKGQCLGDSDLKKCAADYEFPKKAVSCIMGVDVGKYLHVTISKMIDEKLVKQWVGKLNVTSGEGFQELDSYMDLFDVDLCVIDGNPEGRKAKEFQEKWWGRVYLAYYWGADTQKTELYDISRKEVDEGEDVERVMINRTQAADYLHQLWISRKTKIPKSLLLDKEYITQMKAPKRIQKKGRDGNLYYSWEEFNKPDHFFHSDLYGYIAYRIMQDNKTIFVKEITTLDNRRQTVYDNNEADIDTRFDSNDGERYFGNRIANEEY